MAGPAPAWSARLLLAVAVVGPGEQGPLDREGDDGEDARDDGQVQRERDLQARGRRAEEPAGDGADAPDAVEGVEDRAAVVPLDAQPVRVLGHVDDRVQRAGDEHRGGQRSQVGAAAAAHTAAARTGGRAWRRGRSRTGG